MDGAGPCLQDQEASRYHLATSRDVPALFGPEPYPWHSVARIVSGLDGPFSGVLMTPRHPLLSTHPWAAAVSSTSDLDLDHLPRYSTLTSSLQSSLLAPLLRPRAQLASQSLTRPLDDALLRLTGPQVPPRPPPQLDGRHTRSQRPKGRRLAGDRPHGVPHDPGQCGCSSPRPPSSVLPSIASRDPLD